MSDQIPGTEPTQVFITVDRREGKTYVQWGIRGGRNRCIGIITRVPMDSSSPRARGIQYRYRAVHPIPPRSIEDRTRYSWAQCQSCTSGRVTRVTRIPSTGTCGVLP